jgi:hypothetical protein
VRGRSCTRDDHETDALNTVEFGDYFVIVPHCGLRKTGLNVVVGTLPIGFRYSSDWNGVADGGRSAPADT